MLGRRTGKYDEMDAVRKIGRKGKRQSSAEGNVEDGTGRQINWRDKRRVRRKRPTRQSR